MEIRRTVRARAEEARGVVIVLDVLRAFTVAAYAFAGGADELWLVRTVEDALALRAYQPDVLLAGEVGGRLIPGFDLNNSPSRMAASDVRGRVIVQRTGAGTQGACTATNASHLLIAALVNARATAALARQLAHDDTNGAPAVVTLLPTYSRDDPGHPDIGPTEDDVCADYLAALLSGDGSLACRVLTSGIAEVRALGRFAELTHGGPDFPPEDEAAVLAVDRFAFAMAGRPSRLGDIAHVRVRRVDVPSAG
jgi:2-phosphosulfolactate phosphatase